MRDEMKRLFKHLIVAAIVFLAGSVCASAQQQYSDIFEYIRGRVPGVQVGQAGPGQTPSIVIRGVGTNSDHTQPLFIVDGLQTDNIASIDPNNVYQIDIIKDGTSSIYGMQGANGVIMMPGLMEFTVAPRLPQRVASYITRSTLQRFEYW